LFYYNNFFFKYHNPEMEFKEFEPRFKSAKTRFKLSAGLNLETFVKSKFLKKKVISIISKISFK